MTTSIVTVSEFLNELDSHDWMFMYASGPTYFKGSANNDRLRSVAANDDTLNAVYSEYIKFRNGERDKPEAAEFSAVTEVASVDTKAANDDDNSPEGPEPVVMDFNRESVKELVSSGLIFGCQFIKRTTGEMRNMQCRVSVKKHLKGGSKGYSDKTANILTVYDMANNGYRSIPIENIQTLSVRGTIYTRANAIQQAA